MASRLPRTAHLRSRPNWGNRDYAAYKAHTAYRDFSVYRDTSAYRDYSGSRGYSAHCLPRSGAAGGPCAYFELAATVVGLPYREGPMSWPGTSCSVSIRHTRSPQPSGSSISLSVCKGPLSPLHAIEGTRQTAGPPANPRLAIAEPTRSPCEMKNAPDSDKPAGASADSSAETLGNDGEGEALIQYVVLRQDLTKDLKWPMGAVVAQACHAAVDALGLALESSQADAQRYLAAGGHMRTVVLQVSGEEDLLKLQEKLMRHNVKHRLWREEPEKIPTALASVPITKTAGRVFKGYKLLS